MIRRLPGFKEKKLTVELGRKLERLAAYRKLSQPADAELTEWLLHIPGDLKLKLAKWELIDGRSMAEARPLVDHIEDFRTFLAGKGNTDQHVEQTVNRVQAVVKGCHATFPGELNAGKLHNWLADQRARGMGVQTSNYYLTAMKTVCNWMVRDRRLSTNPFRHLEAQNAKADRRRIRRSLSAEDLSLLLETTRQSQNTFRGLTGADRAVLYLTAARTGLRASELRSLTMGSLNLDDDELPSVRIEASREKARNGAVLPLSSELVAELKVWLAERRPEQADVTSLEGNRDQPLWPKTWHKNAAEMLRDDLAETRSTWIAAAKSDPAERERRQQSDRFAYVDHDGRVFDFHSLRGQFVTDLGRAGVPLTTAQKLARHSDPKLTANLYTHLSAVDLASSVDSLPTMNSVSRQRQVATGTDGTNDLAQDLDSNRSKSCQTMPEKSHSSTSGTVADEPAENEKTPVNTEVSEVLTVGQGNRADRTRTCNQRIMSPLL